LEWLQAQGCPQKKTQENPKKKRKMK